jgi:hypothetical protein
MHFIDCICHFPRNRSLFVRAANLIIYANTIYVMYFSAQHNAHTCMYLGTHKSAGCLYYSAAAYAARPYAERGVLRCIMQNAAPRVINYELPSSTTCRSGQNMMYWNSRQHTPTEGAPPPPHILYMVHIMKARMGAKRRCTILYAREPCLMRLCLYSSGRRRVLCVRHNNNTYTQNIATHYHGRVIAALGHSPVFLPALITSANHFKSIRQFSVINTFCSFIITEICGVNFWIKNV